MSLGSPLMSCHPTRPFSIDATTLDIDERGLDSLGWAAAFGAMQALEAGGIANPDEQRQVGHYWLRAPELAPTAAQSRAITEAVEAVTTFAGELRSGAIRVDGQRFTDVLHVGIGGSALGPNLLIDALADPAALAVRFVDNTDPDGIERILRTLGDRLATTLVVVVSKSGGTAETANGAKLVHARLQERGLAVGPRTVAITQEGSQLDREATEGGWLRRFPIWDWVGGRTSVTSAVGLLPAALGGIDLAEFLRGAREMDEWTRTPEWRRNPAALIAGGWHLVGNGRGDRNMVVLPYADRLVLLSRYLQQVVMESLGKRYDLHGREVFQGLTVYGNKGSTDQHAYVQQLRDGRNDFFAVFVQVLSDGLGSAADMTPGANAGDYLQGFLLGTRRALHQEGRPSLVVTVPEVTAYEVGALIALFERAVGLYGSLIEVNAYHQPGVEAGKQAAKSVLELSRRIRGLVGGNPVSAALIADQLAADPLEVFHVLERLAATGRVSRAGTGPTATYQSRS